jgi:hypothetical protein
MSRLQYPGSLRAAYKLPASRQPHHNQPEGKLLLSRDQQDTPERHRTKATAGYCLREYDLVQHGAAPQLQDLNALKEASKIAVPTTEQQMVQTFMAVAVLLCTVVGPENPLYLKFKRELVDEYGNFQPHVETYAASLRGQPVYTQMVRWVQLRCNAY